jgi:hypothetical protein
MHISFAENQQLDSDKSDSLGSAYENSEATVAFSIVVSNADSKPEADSQVVSSRDSTNRSPVVSHQHSIMPIPRPLAPLDLESGDGVLPSMLKDS